MAKPLRLAPGACIIQAEYGYSDEEGAVIQEAAYLKYFSVTLGMTTENCLSIRH